MPETVAEHPAASTADHDEPFAAALEAAKLEALYQFAYGLSHEINNPLANIATRAQTLLIDEKDPERRRKLATINQQAFRAHEMIADLMLFARPPAMRPEPTDLVALAGRVVSEMQSLAAEQGTALVRSGADEPILATVDPTQIAVALAALVQNSLEALRTGGQAEVEISDCGMNAHPSIPTPHFAASTNPKSAIRNLKLTVTDTGPGIPPHIRPHIFDPYFSGREAGRGLGLGLSKAWRIVTCHGGTLTVESSPDGGTRFTIALPAPAE